MHNTPGILRNTLAITLFLLVSACSDLAGHAPRAAPSAALAENAGVSTEKAPTGKTLYESHCASCHGAYALLTTKDGQARGHLVHTDYATMISYCSGLPPLTQGAFDLILGALEKLPAAPAKKPAAPKLQGFAIKPATATAASGS